MSQQENEVSKFLSFVLRHKPDAIGITLDREGWVDISALLIAAANNGQQLDKELLQLVVATSDKKRFALSDDGLRIRAVQGHSTAAVSIDYVEKVPRQYLYHGTARRFLERILNEGLLPGSRQYVHLSEVRATALAVGSRHGSPVVLQIDAGLMHQQAFKFYQAENEVWLTSAVPSTFILPV